MARRALLGSVVALGLAASSLGVVAIAGTGCSHDTDLSTPAAQDGGSDAAPDVDAAPGITVTTLAPARTIGAPVKASATWAAYRLDEGDWHALSPASAGTYQLPLAVARWTVALVCANDDDSLTTVYLHHRTNATPDVTVTLDDSCTPPAPPAEFAFTGTLKNVPPTTQWLDFGYARDSRGDAIPVSGTTGTYEIVGIEPGTWDFSFGVRDESFQAITRFVMRRDHVVTADEVVDVDVTGPGSFAPGTKLLQLRGLIKGDTVMPSIFYAAGGPFGIDVGPQDVPDDQPDVLLAYSTVPEAAQIASDRYRGELTAEQDRRTGTRTITFDIHQAVDLDLTFLPEGETPTVKVLSTAPQVLLETRVPLLANAERHEVSAVASSNRRNQHAFRSTYDAIYVGSAPEVVDTTPDLSGLPGWKPAWALMAGVDVSVFASAFESPHAVGDGTMQRSSSKGVSISP